MLPFYFLDGFLHCTKAFLNFVISFNAVYVNIKFLILIRSYLVFLLFPVPVETDKNIYKRCIKGVTASSAPPRFSWFLFYNYVFNPFGVHLCIW